MRPIISIIVPVYNAEKTIDGCIQSVLRQDFSDFEMILVNDGSKDKSGDICNQYAKADKRIQVIHQKNCGVSHARNTGMAVASGDYITFVDSDDVLATDTLSLYLNGMIEFDCDIIVGGYTRIENNASKKIVPPYSGCMSGEVWELICQDPTIFGYLWNKMFRLEMIRNNRLKLREDMYSQEDLDFCLSAFYVANKVAFIPCTGYRYYYVPSKRIPPAWDFIANQLKLLRFAERKTMLSAEAKERTKNRILLLLYTCLYEASARTDYVETVHRLEVVDGLIPLLQVVSVKSEKGFVAQCFAKGKYNRIRRYFCVRNRIRDVVRKLRKRTKK